MIHQQKFQLPFEQPYHLLSRYYIFLHIHCNYNGYEGRYNIYLKDDTVVQKAIEIFADESQYLSILSNTESTEVASLNN